MTPELLVLVLTAASIGCVHTLLGPDHYLPFIVMAKARRWSFAKAIGITSLCGLGHVASSVTLGAVCISVGIGVGNLELVESVRGDWAAWALITFGVTYFAWCMKRAIKDRPHTHAHHHGDGIVHTHEHIHHHNHSHVHTVPHGAESGFGLTPWALFVIFILGPCEPLIPVLMYPAAASTWGGGVIAVSAVFGLATLVTMTVVVAAGLAGLRGISLGPAARFSHAAAGGAVALSGSAIVFLGL